MEPTTRKRATALYYGAFILIIPVWVAYSTYTRLQQNLEARPHVGSAMPSFRVQQMDGRTAPLQSVLAGRRSAVVFVKAGCPNCKRMLEILGSHPLIRSGELQLVAIAQNKPQEAMAFRTKEHFRGVLLSDVDQAFHKKAGGLTVPLTYLVDEEGRIRGVLDGVKSEPSVASALKPLTGRRSV